MTAVFTIIFGVIFMGCGQLHACHLPKADPPPVEKQAPEKPVTPAEKVP